MGRSSRIFATGFRALVGVRRELLRVKEKEKLLALSVTPGRVFAMGFRALVKLLRKIKM